MPTIVPKTRSEPLARDTGPRLALALQLGERIAEWPVTRSRLRRWVQLALARDAQLTLRLVARAEAIALNRAYRGRDYAPNVLTFAYDTAAGATPTAGAPCRADIVICLPVLRAQARSQGKPLTSHLAHLVIHGVLHAQGHDHIDPREADAMEAIETRLLARLRIPDPYTRSGHAPLD
jgi:probable rRNA maturation factor